MKWQRYICGEYEGNVFRDVTLHSLVPTYVHYYIPEDHNLKMMMHLWRVQCKDWKNKYMKFQVFIAVLQIEVFWRVQVILTGKWLLLQQLFYQPTHYNTQNVSCLHFSLLYKHGGLWFVVTEFVQHQQQKILILWLHHRTHWKLIPLFYPIKVSCGYWSLVLWSNRTAHMSCIYLEQKLRTR